MWMVILILALGGAAKAEDSPSPGQSPKPADAGAERVESAPPPPIIVGVAIPKVITIPDVRRVRVGDPSVLSAVLLDGGRIRLIGLSDERTTLTVWTSDTEQVEYPVSVRHDAGANELVRDVRKLLGDMDGVIVRLIGDRIILDGETYSQDDADRVASVTSHSTKPAVVNLTRPSPASRRLVLAKIKERLVKAGFVDTTLVLSGSTFILTGSLGTDADRARAEAIVRVLLNAH
jgi:pilus assembly protein CpaC